MPTRMERLERTRSGCAALKKVLLGGFRCKSQKALQPAHQDILHLPSNMPAKAINEIIQIELGIHSGAIEP